eukprot:snap_masked-scaffold_4-processed-gene-16.11-mRNA-1 protein AED:1.00 eAED:1.00 QI:0/0/0/0/1/1/2/0/412
MKKDSKRIRTGELLESLSNELYKFNSTNSTVYMNYEDYILLKETLTSNLSDLEKEIFKLDEILTEKTFLKLSLLNNSFESQSKCININELNATVTKYLLVRDASLILSSLALKLEGTSSILSEVSLAEFIKVCLLKYVYTSPEDEDLLEFHVCVCMRKFIWLLGKEKNDFFNCNLIRSQVFIDFVLYLNSQSEGYWFSKSKTEEFYLLFNEINTSSTGVISKEELFAAKQRLDLNLEFLKNYWQLLKDKNQLSSLDENNHSIENQENIQNISNSPLRSVEKLKPEEDQFMDFGCLVDLELMIRFPQSRRSILLFFDTLFYGIDRKNLVNGFSTLLLSYSKYNCRELLKIYPDFSLNPRDIYEEVLELLEMGISPTARPRLTKLLDRRSKSHLWLQMLARPNFLYCFETRPNS